MSWRDRKAVLRPGDDIDDGVADAEDVVRGLRHYRSFWRVRPDRRFVDIDAPAGAVRDDEFAVLHHRGVDEKLIPPGDAVDVDLHHPEIGHRRRRNAR